jgi:DNA repair protein RecO (recombination protein O)
LLLGTGRNWYIVSQAEAQDTYNHLREDLELVGYASYIIEMLDKFTYEEEESNSAIFRVLTNTLKRLDSGRDPFVTVRYYEILLLDLLGFRPELHKCMVSDEEVKAEDQYFSSALGGVVSPEHGRNLAGAVPVSMKALKYMRHFQRSTFQQALRAKVTAETQRELEVLMQHYITYLLERGMNTPAFIRRVRNKKIGYE